MPSYNDVGVYLEDNHLESHLSEAVALCVEEEIPQPLSALAEDLSERAKEAAVGFDYGALTAELRQLCKEQPERAALFLKLSFNDASTYSAAHLPNGGANAALRHADSGEGAFPDNEGLAAFAAAHLSPLKTRHPLISHADLWTLAANVALEALGGPAVHTRFGRRDAAPSFSERGEAELVESPDGRLVDDSALAIEDKVGYLRRLYARKGLGDRELVALQGRHCVGECTLSGGSRPEGVWTAAPQQFSNSYFVALLRNTYEPHATASGAAIYRCEATATVMTPVDMALLSDRKLRGWVEAYAADKALFYADFTAAWTRLQELGCRPGQLVAHPMSLTYASACYLPNEWIELPLLTRREVARDVTVYGFGLPKGQALALPVCACLLLRAPGRGRGAGGKDDWDGSDAVRPYVPISEPSLKGRFELLVRRYDSGASSSYLHGLALGSLVAFRHTRHNLRLQYPFDGYSTITILCGGTGITAAYQALVQILRSPHDERKVVLIDSHRSPEDILLREELDELARHYPHRLTLVHVVGASAEDKPPLGWQTTDTFIAESGWIDEAKVSRHAFPPSHDTLVFVCGLPAMYASLCGPREDKVLRDGTVLARLGYRSDNVCKL
jgi:NAD(P)H-flavin reductase